MTKSVGRCLSEMKAASKRYARAQIGTYESLSDFEARRSVLKSQTDMYNGRVVTYSVVTNLGMSRDKNSDTMRYGYRTFIDQYLCLNSEISFANLEAKYNKDLFDQAGVETSKAHWCGDRPFCRIGCIQFLAVASLYKAKKLRATIQSGTLHRIVEVKSSIKNGVVSCPVGVEWKAEVVSFRLVVKRDGLPPVVLVEAIPRQTKNTPTTSREGKNAPTGDPDYE